MATREVVASPELGFGNPTDEQLMETYRVPAFSLPYPVVINPAYSTSVFKEKVDQWLQHRKVNTVFSPQIYQMLVSMDVCGLVARVYSEVPQSGLEWAWKFFLMLWIWDDTLDCTEIGECPEKALSPLLEVHLMMLWSFPDDPVLRTQLKPILNHFEGQAREEKVRYIESVLEEARSQPGTVYSKPTTGVISDIFLELWKDVTESASSEFCLRLAHAYNRWCLGCLRETEFRKLKTVPSLADYLQIRKGSSGLTPVMTVVDFIYGLNSPDSWFYSAEMQSIMEAINDIVAWHNDLWSFKREVLVAKDKFNIVLAISIDRKVSYTEAAQITTQIMYDRITDLENAGKDLELVTPPEFQRNFEVYMRTCRDWISGSYDWHSKSARYQ
ncbi:unnamed protein product [Calypogeia fissa]